MQTNKFKLLDNRSKLILTQLETRREQRRMELLIAHGNELADRLENCLNKILKIMQENSKPLKKVA